MKLRSLTCGLLLVAPLALAACQGRVDNDDTNQPGVGAAIPQTTAPPATPAAPPPATMPPASTTMPPPGAGTPAPTSTAANTY